MTAQDAIMTCIQLAIVMPIAQTAFVLTADDLHMTSIRIALRPYARPEHKGQAALWVPNGCTSMSKPITT